MPLTALLIYGIFGVLILGSLWNPVIGILGYLSVYMLYNHQIWWGAFIAEHITRPSFIAMAFLIIGCLLHPDKLDWRIKRNEKKFYFFLATAWAVSLFFGMGMNDDSWTYLEKLTKISVFIFIFLRLVNSLADYKVVVWAYIFGAMFLSFQAHVAGNFVGGRLDNIGGIDFNEANAFASFLAFAICMIGYEILRAAWWKRVLYIIAIAAMLNAIIMTQSRGVFLGILLASPFAFFQTPKRYRKQVYVYAALAIALFLMLADMKFSERMSTIEGQARLLQPNGEQREEKEHLNRLDFWSASLKMFSGHPFGVGVKNFEKLVPYYDPKNTGYDAHNTYVLCYTEIGIIGIIIFVSIIIGALFQLRRIRLMAAGTPYENEVTIYSISLNTALLIYLLGSMVTHSYLYSEFLWMLFALPISLENAAERFLEEAKKCCG